MKTFHYIDGIATLNLDEKRCIGCGNCITVCPHRIFHMPDKKASIRNINECMECGACAINCPVEAINVQPGVGCAEAFINMWITRITGKKQNGNNCC